MKSISKSATVAMSSSGKLLVRGPFLDPRNDLTFKKVFGEHPDLVIDFLNGVMPLPHDCFIVSIEYLPSEQVPENPDKKNSIVDVKCKDNFGRIFIIEMQILWFDDFPKRMLFNACKAYVRQLDKGKLYEELKPVYSLALLNENFCDGENFYHRFYMTSPEEPKTLMTDLEFVYIELSKFKPDTWKMRKAGALWLQFMKEVNEKTGELPPELENYSYTNKAAEICMVSAFTPEELAKYEGYWSWVSTQKSIVSTSIKKGRAEGRAEGEAIGLEKGEAIGLKKGEAERARLQAEKEAEKAEKEAAQAEKEAAQAKLEANQKNTVCIAHQAGLSIEKIAEMTGLNQNQIKTILENLKS